MAITAAPLTNTTAKGMKRRVRDSVSDMAITAAPLTNTTAKGMKRRVRDSVSRLTPAKATAATLIHKNSLVMRTTSTGLCLPGADTASCTFAGVIDEACVASTDGTTPPINLRQMGDFIFKMNTSTATEASCGTEVELADDNSVDVAGQTSNHVKCGKICEFIDSTHVRVRIDGYAY